ncbi:hypothetical protein BDZ45DRAFT_808545 [Acephala macrosclerotiorum]|nr:hypothetical protein BDZ45DRAFT_808545 [Acephala macrosclerotiorum]
MPAGPRYERVPLEEENLPSHPINRYFTGLPSTAPPSFRTVPLDQESLPHRNDESAATIMPRSERPSSVPRPEQQLSEVDGISLWGASESTPTRDANSTRDDILLRLLDGVERLEARLDSRDNTKEERQEPDIEALIRTRQQQWTRNDIVGTVLGSFFAILFLIWLGAIIIIPAVAKYKYAGAMASVATASPAAPTLISFNGS